MDSNRRVGTLTLGIVLILMGGAFILPEHLPDCLRRCRCNVPRHGTIFHSH